MSEQSATPSLPELVEGLRERLDAAIDQPLGGFEARVAANVAAIIERELRSGPAAIAAHELRLHAFDVADDRELAAAIRSGRFDHRAAELRHELLASAADQVAINNPKWLAGAPKPQAPKPQAPTIE